MWPASPETRYLSRPCRQLSLSPSLTRNLLSLSPAVELQGIEWTCRSIRSGESRASGCACVARFARDSFAAAPRFETVTCSAFRFSEDDAKTRRQAIPQGHRKGSTDKVTESLSDLKEGTTSKRGKLNRGKYRRGNNLIGLKKFHLKAKARIWH